MYQLLCQLTSYCDNTWSSIPNQNKIEDKVTFKFLKDLMSNKDIASLLGDFAFTIIPKLSEEKKPTIHELENAFFKSERFTMET